MKTDIHPKYQTSKISCACGAVHDVHSAGSKEMHVNICSKCHPFFTGQAKFVDTEGRVERFKKRYSNVTRG